MAKPRDHKAKMEQRNARAFAQGYRGKGGGQAGAYAAARAARAAGQPAPTDKTARPDLRQIIHLGDGRKLVAPRGGQGDRVADRQLAAGDRFQVRATIQTKDGPQEVELFGKGGWKASEIRKLIADHGGLAGAIAYLVSNGIGGLSSVTGGSLGATEITAEAVQDVELTIT